MVDELFKVASQLRSQFSSTVRDQFGHSIISDVFEPLLDDIANLQEMNESFQKREAEIDKLIEEIQSIEGGGYGK